MISEDGLFDGRGFPRPLPLPGPDAYQRLMKRSKGFAFVPPHTVLVLHGFLLSVALVVVTPGRLFFVLTVSLCVFYYSMKISLCKMEKCIMLSYPLCLFCILIANAALRYNKRKFECDDLS